MYYMKPNGWTSRLDIFLLRLILLTDEIFERAEIWAFWRNT